MTPEEIKIKGKKYLANLRAAGRRRRVIPGELYGCIGGPYDKGKVFLTMDSTTLPFRAGGEFGYYKVVDMIAHWIPCWKTTANGKLNSYADGGVS